MWKFEQVYIYEMVINEFDNRYNIIIAHTKKSEQAKYYHYNNPKRMNIPIENYTFSKLRINYRRRIAFFNLNVYVFYVYE